MKTRKAVAYMRYSSDNQQETSIEYQRAKINLYCATNNIALVREYVDRAYSATNDKRPAFQVMMYDAKNKPEWDMVLVYDLSRFSRNYADAVSYKNLLKDLDIKVISTTENFGDSNEGFLMEGIKDLINDYNSRDNARKTHAGMTVKSKKAGHCGGIPPLGYDVDPEGKLIINPEEADTVRRIFNMFELNYSYTRMAKILNEEGRKNKLGLDFGKHSFNSLLRQEKYTGTYIWNRAKAKNSKHKYNSHACKPIEEQTRIEGGCPQIISFEQFQRVQELLDNRAKGRAASKSKYHYMLSGLNILRCAECGSYMIGTSRISRGEQYTTYTCPKHKNGECSTKDIRTSYVDMMVTLLLMRDLFHRNDIDEISNYIRSDTSEYKMLKYKKQRVSRAIANVTKSLEVSCSETIIKKLDALELEKKSIERKLALAKSNVTAIDKDNIRAVCKQFRVFIMESECPEVKAYLKHAVKNVIISNDDVKINVNVA